MSNTKSSSSDPQHPAPQQHTVTEAQDGLRLDRVLSLLPGVASREMGRRLIDEGEVQLNAGAPAPSTRVHAGDVVGYRIPAPRPVFTVIAEQGPLDVLYEDDWLIVINKPPGMPMHPGPGHATGTLVNYLLGHCGDLSGVGGRLRPGIVHRLDMDTSGIVVVAKHDRAHLGLAAQFRERTMQRSYEAIVVGRPPQERGRIDLPVGRRRSDRRKREVNPEGKHAITRWQVERRLGPFTLLRLRLETGRTHQIRVHLAHEGWPVLGDPLYGRGRHKGLRLDPEVMERLNRFRRQALHAAELGFTHPGTGEALTFSAPPPEDMQAILDLLAAHAPLGAPPDAPPGTLPAR